MTHLSRVARLKHWVALALSTVAVLSQVTCKTGGGRENTTMQLVDEDSVLSDREHTWLRGETAADFQGLMLHLDERTPIDSQKIAVIHRRLESWPEAARVAPYSWIDRMLDGESPDLMTFVRTLKIRRNFGNDQLEHGIRHPSSAPPSH